MQMVTPAGTPELAEIYRVGLLTVASSPWSTGCNNLVPVAASSADD